ncbi:DUF2760 domain-containing protein [Acidovorax sp. NCPPB 3859]|nr:MULTISPECIES: DUF2760 domain-containing protein [unclassified Acidovorax]MDA8452360.1 DUF2760 domain-containing protein [Acidovorax sp. GBBC 3297]MDA8461789.1 DUF2760 domain-containing protein [Acidovorax sp. GBBC 3333]MDA8466822.1 DUF2760 domain-containing protein [Acidovorax sp. GBBC 3332]MDA8471837.1 DUF2760 domain-containing protein [Acidovorax sp. GBBC 3299]WCM77645.1 DUF2760 domain-containing protein [Acidovorax sp. GBBC 712]
MTEPQELPFLSRLSLAIGSFFALLGDGRLAARVQALRSGAPLASEVPPPAPAPAPVQAPPPPPPAPVPAPAPVRATANVDAALQLLALLQRESRFVDFLQEDIGAYSDADVGGAARLLHGGARKVLQDTFDLAPVRTEAEGSRLTLPAGFDAAAVRVTGNVVGQPPFTGTLQHKGWRATAVRLPALTEGHDTRVIAPAEVEL